MTAALGVGAVRSLWRLASLALAALSTGVPVAWGEAVSVEKREGRAVELSLRPADPALPGRYKVEVALPPGYDTGSESYPVVYVLDGASLRAEHDELLDEGSIHPAILVAIHNRDAGSRFFDLTPSPDPAFRAASGGLPALARSIGEELKPYVDAHFRTLRDAAHTGIVGNSLGGLAACWLGYHRPAVFGLAGCLEPSLWWHDRELLGQLQADRGRPVPTRFWIMAAEQEYPGMWRDAKRAAAALVARGWREGEDVAFYQVHNGSHGWAAARTQVRDMLHFFLRRARPKLIGVALTNCHGPQHEAIRIRESGEFSNAYLDLAFSGGLRATAIAPELRVADRSVAVVGDGVLGQLWPVGPGWTEMTAAYGGFRSVLAVQGFRLDGYARNSLPERATPITVDGLLGDWGELPFVRADGDTGGFRFGVAYDREAVYIAVAARDERLVTHPSLEDPLDQDGLEILLDARRDPLRSLGRGKERFADFLCVQMTPGDDREPMKLRRRKDGSLVLPDGLRAASLRDAAGFTAELAIPTAALDRAQEGPWTEFRLNVLQYDRDEPDGKVRVIAWQPDWAGGQNIVASGTFAKGLGAGRAGGPAVSGADRASQSAGGRE